MTNTEHRTVKHISHTANIKFIKGQLYKLSVPIKKFVDGVEYKTQYVVFAYNKNRTKNMLFLADYCGNTPVSTKNLLKRLTLESAALRQTESSTRDPISLCFSKIGYKLVN